MQTKWSKGDRVVHSGRPEWGSGQVMQADPASHEGKACQRLVVRFDRAGLKTLTTAFAPLIPASEAPSLPAAMPSEDEGEANPFAEAVTAGETEAAMLRLPEAATDPFLPLIARAKASIGLYRFGETPGGLLDWAATQTGLKDPMTRFNRHELEEWYRRFRTNLDGHVKKLVRELRKSDPGALSALMAEASPSGKVALRKADGER
ncbi:MAG: DUF3553 domain-containing protein [Phycisphaerales bacterium]|nr:MAG: DUF3553 domain-containing protein [Phycisphaerales bacterium]